MRSISLKNKVVFLALIVFALFLPTLFQAAGYKYGILICCLVFVNVVAVSGFDILFGYCGQISIGHAAFFAIGAYTSGILHNKTGIPAIITMLVAASVAACVGAVLAYPASKLMFHFLSLATMAFGEIVYQFIVNSPGGITGNARGLFSAPINLFGFQLDTNVRFYFFALACVVVVLGAKYFIVDSKVGRAFVAIRENTHAADGMGIDVRKYKIISFAISAFCTGFAGGMYMHFVKYISPETFTGQQSVTFIIMLLFGGTASILGPVIGVVTVLLLTEVLRPLQEYQMLIYGAMLLLVIVVIPGGVWGTIVSTFQKLTQKKVKKGGDGGA